MSISVQGLVKSYGALRIVHGISFEVAAVGRSYEAVLQALEVELG